jgi:hypothetical protein
MTPKEKSKELIEKFKNVRKYYPEDFGYMDYEKQCALWVVDEMLTRSLWYSKKGVELAPKDQIEFKEFWYDVKKEIESL